MNIDDFFEKKTLHKLPSLNGLKAFEAAARHMSFTKAAEELHVTQTAISHQVNRLEEELGMRLFYRGKSGLALTSDGMTYFPSVRLAFRELRSSTEFLLQSYNNNTLTLTTLVSLASKWLLPRLGTFKSQYPEIDVRISASTDLVDFYGEGIDAAIRYGNGNWEGLRSDWLMSDDIFPVCSPMLVQEGKLESIEDLANHTLLQVSGLTSNDWNTWLSAAGLARRIEDDTRLTFDLALMAVQAATDGLGVCIGRTSYVEEDIKAGRLVVPFDMKISSNLGFWFVTPKERTDCRKVAAFRQWLIKSIRETGR